MQVDIQSDSCCIVVEYEDEEHEVSQSSSAHSVITKCPLDILSLDPLTQSISYPLLNKSQSDPTQVVASLESRDKMQISVYN